MVLHVLVMSVILMAGSGAESGVGLEPPSSLAAAARADTLPLPLSPPRPVTPADPGDARLRIFPFAGYGFRSRIRGIDVVGGARGLRAESRSGLELESLQGGLVWARLYRGLGLMATGMRVGRPAGGRATVVGLAPSVELPAENPHSVFRRVRGSLSLGPAVVRDAGADRGSLFLSLDAESPFLGYPHLALYVGFSGHLTERAPQAGGFPRRLGVARAGLGLRF